MKITMYLSAGNWVNGSGFSCSSDIDSWDFEGNPDEIKKMCEEITIEKVLHDWSEYLFNDDYEMAMANNFDEDGDYVGDDVLYEVSYYESGVDFIFDSDEEIEARKIGSYTFWRSKLLEYWRDGEE